MNVLRLAVAVVLTFVAAPAGAFEYPSTPLATAIGRGQLAFRGRVEVLTQLTRGFNSTLGRATVLVEECYYGPCVAGKRVAVDYLAQSIKDEVDQDFGYATRFPLAAEILFVFDETQSGREGLSFNVKVRESTAMAYVLNDMPNGWPEEELRPYSVYALRPNRGEPPVTREAITKLAEPRRLELSRTTPKP
jgi:hypothetical protein